MLERVVLCRKHLAQCDSAYKTAELAYVGSIEVELRTKWNDAVKTLIPILESAAIKNLQVGLIEAEMRRHSIEIAPGGPAVYMDLIQGRVERNTVVNPGYPPVAHFVAETSFSRWLRRMENLGLETTLAPLLREDEPSIVPPDVERFNESFSAGAANFQRRVHLPAVNAFRGLAERFASFSGRFR